MNAENDCQVVASREEPAEQVDAPQFLHSATLWAPPIDNLRRSIVPLFIGSFVVGPVAIWFYPLFVLLPSVLYYGIRYLTVTYRIRPSELQIHSGWLNRRERRIPFDRIQEVELVQGLVRRPMAVTCLKIKTAGSDSEEASLDAIRVVDAREIRDRTLLAQSKPQPQQEGALILGPVSSDLGPVSSDYECRLTWKELVIGGLTSHVTATIGAMVAAV
ncbi:MAG: PH domain-containing protein, partial [Planctomycetota bacterium]